MAQVSLGTVGQVCQEYLKKGSRVYWMAPETIIEDPVRIYYSKVVALQMQSLTQTTETIMTLEEDSGEYEAICCRIANTAIVKINTKRGTKPVLCLYFNLKSCISFTLTLLGL